jgi:ABC-type branched-subunit amino acid transport system ATPase component
MRGPSSPPERREPAALTKAVGALSVRDLGVRYGGRVALEGLSLDAPAGTITGLIGPNGAGKSTTFNAIAGVVHGTGTVTLGTTGLDGRSPRQRAQLGLGRTFQRTQLFDTMTVAENVAMGRELLMAGRSPWHHMIATRRDVAECRAVAQEAMIRCGIRGLAASFVGELSTGNRRLVELARAITGAYAFLLLDEPSSGLDAAETEQFGAVLRDLATRDGTGILLVEHDMSLVRSCCTTIYVLDFGRPLLHGPADEVLASDLLRAAYLGTESGVR